MKSFGYDARKLDFLSCKVETSLQYLVRNWNLIVEFISVWKRLSEFEAKLNIANELGPEVS